MQKFIQWRRMMITSYSYIEFLTQKDKLQAQ